MTLHRSFRSYRRYRYLKFAIFAGVFCAVAYAAIDPPGGHNGGTWFGYGMGTICALLMLWLMWFGARKRSYGGNNAPLTGWLSAHVYFGLLLAGLVPLHSGFQFGANIHTAAYVLVLAVVVSGIAGVLFYTAVPRRMTDNRPGERLEGLLEQIADIDVEVGGIASAMPDAVSAAVAGSISASPVSGSFFSKLSRSAPGCPTAAAIDVVGGELARTSGPEREEANRLLEMLGAKQALVGRVRRDVRLKALLDLWLIAHVPLAFASIAAVAVHVFVVLYLR